MYLVYMKLMLLSGDMAISSPPSTGNSLGARGGWSSDFDQPQLTAGNPPVRDRCKKS